MNKTVAGYLALAAIALAGIALELLVPPSETEAPSE